MIGGGLNVFKENLHKNFNEGNLKIELSTKENEKNHTPKLLKDAAKRQQFKKEINKTI